MHRRRAREQEAVPQDRFDDVIHALVNHQVTKARPARNEVVDPPGAMPLEIIRPERGGEISLERSHVVHEAPAGRLVDEIGDDGETVALHGFGDPGPQLAGRGRKRITGKIRHSLRLAP